MTNLIDWGKSYGFSIVPTWLAKEQGLNQSFHGELCRKCGQPKIRYIRKDRNTYECEICKDVRRKEYRVRKKSQLSVNADKEKIAQIIQRAKRLTIETGIFWEVHHIVPLLDEGSDHENNLIALPRPIHVEVHRLLRKSTVGDEKYMECLWEVVENFDWNTL